MCYFVEILCLQSSARYTWHTWQLPRTSRDIIFFDENYVSAWHTVLFGGDALLALLENEVQLLSLASSELVPQMFGAIATFLSLPAVDTLREKARHHFRLHCPQMIRCQRIERVWIRKMVDCEGSGIYTIACASHIMVVRDSIPVTRKLTV